MIERGIGCQPRRVTPFLHDKIASPYFIHRLQSLVNSRDLEPPLVRGGGDGPMKNRFLALATVLSAGRSPQTVHGAVYLPSRQFTVPSRPCRWHGARQKRPSVSVPQRSDAENAVHVSAGRNAGLSRAKQWSRHGPCSSLDYRSSAAVKAGRVGPIRRRQ